MIGLMAGKWFGAGLRLVIECYSKMVVPSCTGKAQLTAAEDILWLLFVR
jgi:hypothetical protein